MSLYSIGLYTQAALYLLAGLNHLRKPRFYLRMMPPYLPWHKPLVLVSGVVEVLLAVLLVLPATRVYAAWGIVAMLVVYLTVHVYMLQPGPQRMGLSTTAAWVRLLLQGVLLAWAWVYTR